MQTVQLSDTPTNKLLIKSDTTTDNPGIEVAIITITPEWVVKTRKRMRAILIAFPFEKVVFKEDIAKVEFCEECLDDFGKETNDILYEERLKLLERVEEKTARFVKADIDNILPFAVPEIYDNGIRQTFLHIYSDGRACFITEYGEHNSYGYSYTDKFDLNEILNQCENTNLLK